MEDDGVEANAIEEGQVRRELLDLVEDGTSDLDDSELCGVRAIGGAGEDAEVALDFALGANGVEQASDCILGKVSSVSTTTRAFGIIDVLYRSGPRRSRVRGLRPRLTGGRRRASPRQPLRAARCEEGAWGLC